MKKKTKKNKLNNKKINSKKGGSFQLPNKTDSDSLTHNSEENAELVRCQQELEKCNNELFLANDRHKTRGIELQLTIEELLKCNAELEECKFKNMLDQQGIDNAVRFIEEAGLKDQYERYLREQSSFIMPQTG